MKHVFIAIVASLVLVPLLGCAPKDTSQGTEAATPLNPLIHSNESHRRQIKKDALEIAGAARTNLLMLEAALDYNNETVRWAAQDALVSMGHYAVPVLMNVLRHGDQRAREHACTALQRIGPEGSLAIPLLLELLERDQITANYAARALSTVGKGSTMALDGLRHAHQRGLRSGGAIEATLGILEKSADKSPEPIDGPNRQ